MGLDLLFVSSDPFFIVVVFREIDVELVFSSHRVGGRSRAYEYII